MFRFFTTGSLRAKLLSRKNIVLSEPIVGSVWISNIRYQISARLPKVFVMGRFTSPPLMG